MNKAKYITKKPTKDSVKVTHGSFKPDSYLFLMDVFALCAIILLGVLVYSNSFDCTFHLDDRSSIMYNAAIKDLTDIKTIWDYNHNRFVPYYSFALNYHIHELDLWGYHFFNLVIHLINACLVWWLTTLIFKSPALENDSVVKYRKSIALITALMFVSHPLATQSVTYIVQRLASIAALFYLSSVSLFIKARLTHKTGSRNYLLYIGSFICGVLALLSKENAYTLPLAIFISEILFQKNIKSWLNFKNLLITLFIITSGIFAFYFSNFSLEIFKSLPPTPNNPNTLTPLNYLFTQFSVIIKYIQLLVLPVNQNIDHDFTISENFFDLRTILSFSAIVGLLVVSIVSFKKIKVLTYGILWYLLTLSVESSFIPITDVIFEHRTYLPSFGFFLVTAYFLCKSMMYKYQSALILVVAVIIGCYSVLTYNRNKVWKTELSLWTDAVSKSPKKARPFINRGYAYANLNEWNKAIADFSQANSINPKFHAAAYYNLGIAYGILGDNNKAFENYNAAMEVNPLYDGPYFGRGFINHRTGKYENAIDDYTKTIQLNPNYRNVYLNRGLSYNAISNWDDAITDFTREIALDPNSHIAYFNRAIAFAKTEQWDRALNDFNKTIELDPGNQSAYQGRDFAQSRLGGGK